jgi:hypothetical protein
MVKPPSDDWNYQSHATPLEVDPLEVVVVDIRADA